MLFNRIMLLKLTNFDLRSRQRPYHIENTSSRPITEVKQCWARLVLGWETAWEPLVLLSILLLIEVKVNQSLFVN